VNQAIDALRNAFKIPELRERIFFTILIVAVYRLGAHVPTPGIDGAALSDEMGRQGGLLGFYNLFTGGAFEQASIFALGIMPYISASIIFQLLVAVVPALEKIAKGGPDGQKKITEYTRYATIGLAIFQSLGVAALLQRISGGAGGFIMVDPLPFYLICVITFTTGTAFIMWLGEQISEFGVGNGMSLIIFVSIIAGLPGAVGSLASMFPQEIGPVRLILLMFGMVLLIAGVIYVTTAQRRVPVQYPRQVKGRQVMAGARNYLPLKVTQAGVIPIIFAASILMLPGMVVPALGVDALTDWYQRYLVDHSSVFYNIVYASLIIFFSYFYTAIIFNPVEYAENLQKQNAIILGVRPGKATAEYLNTVMVRITFVGSMFLAGVAMVPNIVFSTMEIYDWRIAQFFGGTSLLILVGVGLDTVRQIETHLTMRNYDGFMKGRQIKGRRRF
jgi:preprotein translocase subunit SecY